MIIIVTGVSGSGKTTLGSLLAKKLRLPFFDADDFHPTANVEKMTQGIPLTDHDRLPWLEHLAEISRQWESEGGGILACSALREQYRQILQVVPSIVWLHLKGQKDLLTRKAIFTQRALYESRFIGFSIGNMGRPGIWHIGLIFQNTG
jgi:6-phosphogluconate dehydrogenase